MGLPLSRAAYSPHMSPGRLNIGLWEVPKPNTISAMFTPHNSPFLSSGKRKREYWIYNPMEPQISQPLYTGLVQRFHFRLRCNKTVI